MGRIRIHDEAAHLVEVPGDMGAEPPDLTRRLQQVRHHDRRHARGRGGTDAGMRVLQGQAQPGLHAQPRSGTGPARACRRRSPHARRRRGTGHAGRGLPNGAARCRAWTTWLWRGAGAAHPGRSGVQRRPASSGGGCLPWSGSVAAQPPRTRPPGRRDRSGPATGPGSPARDGPPCRGTRQSKTALLDCQTSKTVPTTLFQCRLRSMIDH